MTPRCRGNKEKKLPWKLWDITVGCQGSPDFPSKHQTNKQSLSGIKSLQDGPGVEPGLYHHDHLSTDLFIVNSTILFGWISTLILPPCSPIPVVWDQRLCYKNKRYWVLWGRKRKGLVATEGHCVLNSSRNLNQNTFHPFQTGWVQHQRQSAVPSGCSLTCTFLGGEEIAVA